MAGETEVNKSGDIALDDKITEWLSWDKNENTHEEVASLAKDSQWAKLSSVLLKGRLEFGTAGLRGPMKAGYTCMNDLVVLQTAQGLCEYIKKTCTSEQLNAGIIVGFDGRYNSKKFAEFTTKVFTNSSIRVCLFGDVCPTPWVSFAVKYYGAAAGVMVTASHNPKEDNGYKVYWSNAAQIIAPHDKNIEEAILANLIVKESHWDRTGIRDHPLVTDRLEEISKEYLSRLVKTFSPENFSEMAKANIQVVYSAMHGVGYSFIKRAFSLVGLKPVIPVIEQRDPDPDFPTVVFPNPEEPASLEMSLKLAEEKGCFLVLANDPDADRLAVAEYQFESESWHILSGNEAGTLLGWWSLTCFLNRNPQIQSNEAVMLASAVSSKMLRSIAVAKGARFMETLTGFKWMGSKAVQLQKENKHPIFAFEEAIGFMCGCEVPDKDGISAAVHFAALCSHLRNHSKTLMEQLECLYSEFGYHITDNSYYICHDKDVLKSIFEKLRNYNGQSKYPEALRDWEITSVRDLGFKGDEKASAGTGLNVKLPSGEMLTLTFKNGLVATLRTSGTEPKIKYYTELCAEPGQGSKEEIRCLLKNMVTALIEDFLQPKENGLIERT